MVLQRAAVWIQRSKGIPTNFILFHFELRTTLPQTIEAYPRGSQEEVFGKLLYDSRSMVWRSFRIESSSLLVNTVEHDARILV